jgi:hypothetical protein
MATTSEDVWRLLAELTAAQKETDRQLKETDRQLKEVSQQQKETELLLKEVSQQQKENAQQQKNNSKNWANKLGDSVQNSAALPKDLPFLQWKRFSDNALVWKLSVPVCGPVKKDNT